MTEEFRSIRPKPVELTRPSDTGAGTSGHGNGHQDGHRTRALVLSAVAALLVISFVIAPRLVSSPDTAAQTGSSDGTKSAATPAPLPSAGETEAILSASPSTRPTAGPGSAPYADQARERAREAAQAALSRFVELELRIQAEMQTEPWGSARLTEAKTLAATGDEAFTRDDFADAATAYSAGADLLDAVLNEGQSVLAEGIARGEAALTARDAGAAQAAFASAASVAPEAPRVVAGLARAALLPEVNARLRSARNHELAGSWDAALADLDAVSALDPATEGIAAFRDRVAAAAGEAQLQITLSQAFAHLDAGADAEARSAFEAALRIDPGNTAARGGLEALSRNAEARRLAKLAADAAAALADEAWDRADQLYGEALAIDANVQFAVAGRAEARAQRDAAAALNQVLKDPDRLSSPTNYGDAERALAGATALPRRGPRLEGLIADVRQTLNDYAQPVQVTLRSDNATRVTVSTVGELGTFSEKLLELRPGAYTVIGSQDGCRDVRTRILVRPEMAPVEIRCGERL